MTDERSNAKTPFCSTSDASPNDPYIGTASGDEIALFQTEGGEYYAITNVCPHQNGPLGEGKVEDGCVYCPWHGWQFDLETGDHVHGKATAETYEVSVEGDEIFVDA